MCLAVPAKVVVINKNMATVDMMGNTRSADITLLEDVSVGDYILVHAGFGIQKLDPQSASESLEAFDELRRAMENEAV